MVTMCTVGLCAHYSSVPDALRAMHYYGLLLSSTTNRQDALYRPPPEVSVLPPYRTSEPHPLPRLHPLTPRTCNNDNIIIIIIFYNKNNNK
jgi:hypothetical protein